MQTIIPSHHYPATPQFHAPLLLILIFGGFVTTYGKFVSPNPPSRPENAAFARRLVSQATWGAISTFDLDQSPSTNIVPVSQFRGVPYFFPRVSGGNYVPTGRASLTISAYTIGSCFKATTLLDPQAPTCAKITLSGQLKSVKETSKEGTSAKSVFFKGNRNNTDVSRIIRLEIRGIFLVNAYAPARDVPVDVYKKIII